MKSEKDNVEECNFHLGTGEKCRAPATIAMQFSADPYDVSHGCADCMSNLAPGVAHWRLDEERPA